MNFSPLRDKEKSTWNCVIPLLCTNFYCSKPFETLKGPLETFLAAVRQKIYDTKTCFTTPVRITFWHPKSVRHRKIPLRIVIYPSCARKFPDIRNFQKHSSTVRPRTFSVVWDKNFYVLSCAQKLSKPEISESYKGSFTKFFGFVRPSNFREKIVKAPLFCVTIFHARNLVKH